LKKTNKNKKIAGVEVYLERRKTRELVGVLKRENKTYIFKYHLPYVYGKSSIPLGPDLELREREHKSRKLFPTFEDRIPSRRNAAYEEYCSAVGITSDEDDELVLVATLGQKGPSSFVFAPAYNDEFTGAELYSFRRKLDLSLREFGDIFDVSPATLTRIENNKSSGREVLKRVEIYIKFPDVALFELKRNGHKIKEDKRKRLKTILLEEKNS
jgi:HipA-like protein